ncbi:MAG: anthranilate phosphoribosyltransferase [Acidimicrobiales bacterium]
MSALQEHGGWSGVLGRLASGEDLSSEITRAVLGTILAGDATDAQIAAFIVALRLKGETVDELAGLQGAMLDAATPLTLPEGTIDIVGVGGAPSRRVHALNVSTMAAFVAAAAGAVVCKHGNRKASSTSGSFDLLEALYVPIEVSPDELEAQVRDVGVGFAFARTFHPAMRHVGPVRAELGIPTVFNILGPLSHPARLTRQVIGVADWTLAPSMIEVLRATGSIRSLIVHGDGGLDELSTTGPREPCRSIRRDHGGRDRSCRPRLAPTSADSSRVGTQPPTPPSPAARFAGERGPVRYIVVLNAAAGLLVAGMADDLADGSPALQDATDDGRAETTLAALVAPLTADTPIRHRGISVAG